MDIFIFLLSVSVVLIAEANLGNSKLICKRYEVYSPCPPKCPPERSCEQYFSGYEYSCLRPNVSDPCCPKCICRNGYLRRDSDCVLPENCCKDVNAEVVENPYPCSPTCDNPNGKTPCKKKIIMRGCQCKEGFILNAQGKCIRISNCPRAICGVNEEFSLCKNPCPETCSSITSFEPQPVCSLLYPCPPGCQCIFSYVRNNSNACVPRENCPIPTCPGDNEEFRFCKNPCPPSCRTITSGEVQPICDPMFPCPGGCECVNGYVRNDNGVCVKPEQCPIPQCGTNEEFKLCRDLCPKTCQSITRNSTQPICEDWQCLAGCDCLPGFVRNDFNACIPQTECGCLDPNAVVVYCPNPCPITCNNQVSYGTIPCPKACIQVGCQCKEGYVLDENEICIRAETCPPTECGLNEDYNSCPKWCVFEDDCSTYLEGIKYDCTLPVPGERICKPRCECSPGFLRRNQICVEPMECCGDPFTHEIVPCPIKCDVTCDGTTWPNCKKECFGKQCVCKEDFLRDSNNNCVSPYNCPKKPCGQNEFFSFCKYLCRDTCATVTSNEIQPQCSKPRHCPPGCLCIDGYVRNANNTCINQMDCKCPDPNAVVTPFPDPFFLTCHNLDVPLTTQSDSTQVLKIGCVCKQGYILNEINGKCIPINDCPSRQCKENEEWIACPRYCTFDEDCLSYVDGIIRDCPAPPEEDFPCNGRCACLPGFVRVNNTCTLPQQCCSEPFTELVSCPAPCEATCTHTPAKNCTIECPLRRCSCKAGYVKADNNKCIPKTMCPKQCSGANEEYLQCGPACPQTCEIRKPKCKMSCTPGCFCKKGYLRKKNQCVLPCHCNK